MSDNSRNRMDRFRELQALVAQAESVRFKISAIDEERRRLQKLENEIYQAKKNLQGLIDDATYRCRNGKGTPDDRAIMAAMAASMR